MRSDTFRDVRLPAGELVSGEVGCLLAALLFVPSIAGSAMRSSREPLDDSSKS